MQAPLVHIEGTTLGKKRAGTFCCNVTQYKIISKYINKCFQFFSYHFQVLSIYHAQICFLALKDNKKERNFLSSITELVLVSIITRFRGFPLSVVNTLTLIVQRRQAVRKSAVARSAKSGS